MALSRGSNRLATPMDVQLAVEVARVLFNRLCAHEQPCGDLLIRQALLEHPQDLDLTIRQELEGRGLCYPGLFMRAKHVRGIHSLTFYNGTPNNHPIRSEPA